MLKRGSEWCWLTSGFSTGVGKGGLCGLDSRVKQMGVLVVSYTDRVVGSVQTGDPAMSSGGREWGLKDAFLGVRAKLQPISEREAGSERVHG